MKNPMGLKCRQKHGLKDRQVKRDKGLVLIAKDTQERQRDADNLSSAAFYALKNKIYGRDSKQAVRHQTHRQTYRQL